MPRVLTQRQKAWSAGYEEGSAMSKLSPEERKAVKERMKQADRDLRAFEIRAHEAGWAVTKTRSARSMSEV
jgi:multidrug resistance efflux pump